MDTVKTLEAHKIVSYKVRIADISVDLFKYEKYVAMDLTGIYYAYKELPYVKRNAWVIDEGYWRPLAIQVSREEAMSWEYSLRKIVHMK